MSARYGLLDLEQPIDPYDLRMGQPGCVSSATLAAQAHRLGVANAAEVIVLAGKAYADAAAAVWPHARRPFDGTTSMGEQLRLAAAIARVGALPADNRKEDQMRTAALPRKRTRPAAGAVHEMTTTPVPHSPSLVEVSCACGVWKADATVRDALAATIYREHTGALAKAAKETPRKSTAAKSSTTAAPTRRARKATAAELTEVEDLFAKLLGDTITVPTPVIPKDRLVHAATLEALGKGTRYRVGGTKILTYERMEIASSQTPTVFRIYRDSGAWHDIDAGERCIEIPAPETIEYERRETRLLYPGTQRNVLGTVEAQHIGLGVYCQVTGRLPFASEDDESELVGYVIDACQVIKNFEGWTTDECMVLTMAEHPHHLDGVAVQVPLNRKVDVLDTNIPSITPLPAGAPAPWRRPTLQEALAEAGLRLGPQDGPGTVTWKMPWSKVRTSDHDLQRCYFSAGNGPATYARPILKQRYLDKAVQDGVWPGRAETGAVPVARVRQGAHGTITGRVDGVTRTVTGEFHHYWRRSHGNQRYTTVNVSMHTRKPNGELLVLDVEIPATGADFHLHATGARPELTNLTVGEVLPLGKVPFGTYGTINAIDLADSRRAQTGYLTTLPRVFTGGPDGRSRFRGVELLSLRLYQPYTHSPGGETHNYYVPLGAMFTVQQPPADRPLPADGPWAFWKGRRVLSRDVREGDVVSAGTWGQPEKAGPLTVETDPVPLDDAQVQIAVSAGGKPTTVTVDGYDWIYLDKPVRWAGPPDDATDELPAPVPQVARQFRALKASEWPVALTQGQRPGRKALLHVVDWRSMFHSRSLCGVGVPSMAGPDGKLQVNGTVDQATCGKCRSVFRHMSERDLSPGDQQALAERREQAAAAKGTPKRRRRTTAVDTAQTAAPRTATSAGVHTLQAAAEPGGPPVGSVLALHEVPYGAYGTVKGIGHDGSRRTETGFLAKLPRIYTGGAGMGKTKHKGVELLSISMNTPHCSVGMYCRLDATFTVATPPAGMTLDPDSVLTNLGCRLPRRDLRAGDVVSDGYLGSAYRSGRTSLMLADPIPRDGDRVELTFERDGETMSLTTDGYEWVSLDKAVPYRPAPSTAMTVAGQLAALRADAANPSRTNIGRRLSTEQADRYEAGHPLVTEEYRAGQEWGWMCPVPTCQIGRASMATARVAKRSWQAHCTAEAGKNHPADFVGQWPEEYPVDVRVLEDAVSIEYGEHIAWRYKVGSRWAYECSFDHGGVPHVEVAGSQHSAEAYAIAHARALHGVKDPAIPTDDDLLPVNPASDIDPQGLYRRVRDEALAILNTADEHTDADLLAWAAGVAVVGHTVDVDRYIGGGCRGKDLVSAYRGGSLENGRRYDADRSNGFRVYTLGHALDLGRDDLVKVTWARVKKLIDRATQADPLLLRRIEQAGWRRGRALRETLDHTPALKLADRTCHEVVAMLWDAARPGPGSPSRSTRTGPRLRKDRTAVGSPNRTAQTSTTMFDLEAFMAEARSALV